MNASSGKYVCRYACMCVYVHMYVFLLMPLPPSPWKFQSVYLLELQAQHLCQSVRNIQLCSSKSRKITNFKIWTENTNNAYDWKHMLIHNEISVWFILDYLPNKNGAPAYIAVTGNSSMINNYSSSDCDNSITMFSL
jgi:hypothetical protein